MFDRLQSFERFGVLKVRSLNILKSERIEVLKFRNVLKVLEVLNVWSFEVLTM